MVNTSFMREPSVRVLQLYRTYFPDTQGGVEEVVRQIAINTKQFGVETKILIPSNNVKKIEKITLSGIKVYRVPELIEVASCNIYRSGFKLLEELVSWSDIVHYHYPWPFQDFLHFSHIRKYKKKTVVTYHSDIIRQQALLKIYRPLKSRFLNDVDCIVATSPNYAKSSCVLKKYAEKVSIIPLGFSDAVLPRMASNEVLQRWKSKVGEGFFFFVGVLRYYKGLHVLLKAARLSGLKVVIAGSGFEAKNLESLKYELELDNVELLGRVSDEDKAALISLSRAIVLPSFLRSEAFGVSLLEGMFYSKPLITAELNTGVNFVNQHNLTGLMVDPESARSLSLAMLKLHRNPDLASKMGIFSRKRYEELFSGERLGADYARLYRDLMEEKWPTREDSNL